MRSGSKGEADFDGTYSFIGGKLEHGDGSILNGMKREKDEEVGPACRIKVYPRFTTQEEFRKKDGSFMILPHIFAVHVGGPITINEEYDAFRWVPLTELDTFEPKIPTIGPVVKRLLQLAPLVTEADMVEI